MRVVRVPDDDSAGEGLSFAAQALRDGKLVAFPTETVYGLGANALDEHAVRRIYEAKGRPALNPLIVHVADAAAARALAAEWTTTAERLAAAFWPGPLTLVVRKVAHIPDIVSAGRDSVGLRVPSHPVALRLLRLAGVPVAAPSANRSTQVSPTTAGHVERGLGGRVDVIVDGGPTTVGIESTVVDVTGPVPRVLRPGMISQQAIARIIGHADSVERGATSDAPLSPGMAGRHYSPRARVRLFDGGAAAQALGEARAVLTRGGRVAAVVFAPLPIALTTSFTMPRDPAGYARALYATLHGVDEAGCELVLVERPPDEPEWIAIVDRLERATR